MSHLALVQALRHDALRFVGARASVLAHRLEDAVPRAAPVLAWMRANRRDLAAVTCALIGTLLVAAGGGLL